MFLKLKYLLKTKNVRKILQRERAKINKNNIRKKFKSSRFNETIQRYITVSFLMYS